MRPRPLRHVILREWSQSPNAALGHGRVRLTLSCGHELYRKASSGKAKMMRCPECRSELTLDGPANPEFC